MRKTHAFASLSMASAALALALTGCSTQSGSEGGAGDHNDADVAFATEMIQHHAQALQMVDMTVDRPLDPEFEALAHDIRDAQGPEIETLTDWLQEWDEPIPATVRDHVNSHGGHGADSEDDTGSDMRGMMGPDDMAALDGAEDSAFEDMWLQMMIEHHEGAIEMARVEEAEGKHGPARELAAEISSGQSAEIETMRSMLS